MDTMATPGKPAPDRPTARARLLAAANELFYKEGVNTVGIDRVIERAGVAKATLYSAFGSKEELIRAYLAGRQDARRRQVTEVIASHETPRAQILGIFDALGESIARPDYHGCAFVNANAEARPGSRIAEVTDEHRAWMREAFVDLGTAAGAADPGQLSRGLMLLYDGAAIAARLDRDLTAAASARDCAALLLDAATAPGAER
ncbi:TetR/AcrR family transcriptional regulator [Streptacidiphilus sp. P02-A3a]|uniref:TetR/AcrR family transcriptional regulator n=1 Tax=Streptacidiphilus sp. P02-A3a TaxID=2704468 RepID=UPI0015FC86A3|nr:TetR/AcrR family transcriptional regulator [Streptacidiphilus sp. P02-A3a]QMU69400.1 TetR/AcrR family transcriptional regulator [Streptacidiphilus sp. P02-A3a]